MTEISPEAKAVLSRIWAEAGERQAEKDAARDAEMRERIQAIQEAERAKKHENIIYLEFEHEVNDRYCVQVGVDATSITEVEDGYLVTLDNEPDFTVGSDCVRTYDTD